MKKCESEVNELLVHLRTGPDGTNKMSANVNMNTNRNISANASVTLRQQEAELFLLNLLIFIVTNIKSWYYFRNSVFLRVILVERLISPGLCVSCIIACTNRVPNGTALPR